jgi:hypothetical protein
LPYASVRFAAQNAYSLERLAGVLQRLVLFGIA